MPLDGEDNRLRLADVQDATELFNAALVSGPGDDEPGDRDKFTQRGRLLDRGLKLVVDCRWNQDLLVEQLEKFETTDAGKTQNGRGVGNDDQRRSSASRVRRSSWNSSTP